MTLAENELPFLNKFLKDSTPVEEKIKIIQLWIASPIEIQEESIEELLNTINRTTDTALLIQLVSFLHNSLSVQKNSKLEKQFVEALYLRLSDLFSKQKLSTVELECAIELFTFIQNWDDKNEILAHKSLDLFRNYIERPDTSLDAFFNMTANETERFKNYENFSSMQNAGQNEIDQSNTMWLNIMENAKGCQILSYIFSSFTDELAQKEIQLTSTTVFKKLIISCENVKDKNKAQILGNLLNILKLNFDEDAIDALTILSNRNPIVKPYIQKILREILFLNDEEDPLKWWTQNKNGFSFVKYDIDTLFDKEKPFHVRRMAITRLADKIPYDEAMLLLKDSSENANLKMLVANHLLWKSLSDNDPDENKSIELCLEFLNSKDPTILSAVLYMISEAPFSKITDKKIVSLFKFLIENHSSHFDSLSDKSLFFDATAKLKPLGEKRTALYLLRKAKEQSLQEDKILNIFSKHYNIDAKNISNLTKIITEMPDDPPQEEKELP